MKPSWIRTRLCCSDDYHKVKSVLNELDINTVCESALCPNRAECFSRGTATFMILGDVCTRDCSYCNISTGKPAGVDPDEPVKISEAVQRLGLRHVVITSVTRDDLACQGATQFMKVVKEIKNKTECRIELLIPDFNHDNLAQVMNLDIDVLNHNMEVAKRLFPSLRPQGDYSRSINVLKNAKEMYPETTIKSGFMVGVGETIEEVKKTIQDLANYVDVLTIGQYLQPSKKKIPVQKYYSPEEFSEIKEYCKNNDINEIFAGPFVRSSYNAEFVLNTVNKKL